MSPDLLPAIAAFARVAHHASFTRAAAELGVSPSALSQTVRMLERRLDVRLLDRSTRHVGVTEIGQRFLADAQAGLATLSHAVDGLDEARSAPSGTLRLNVSRTAVDIVLAPHLATFIDAHPGITLDIQCENGFVDLVRNGFDAGIRLGENLAQDVVAVPLGGRHRMATVAAPSYLAVHGTPRTPEDLAQHRCLNARLQDGTYRWEFAQKGRAFDMEVAGPLYCNDGDVLLAAARAGAGVFCGFEVLMQPDFDAGRLVPLLKPWWPGFPGFYLYHPSRAQVPRKLRAFIDFMRNRNAGAGSPARAG